MGEDEWPAVAGAAVASLYVQMAVTWPTSGRCVVVLLGHAAMGGGERCRAKWGQLSRYRVPAVSIYLHQADR
jgi:hypothetical protein